MNCEEVQELLSMMLDDELPEDARASVMEHIAACPECMKVYEAFSVLSDSMGELADVPEGFTDDVMRKINAKRAAPKRRRYFAGALGAAACFALLVTAGWRVLGGMGMSADAPDAAARSMKNSAPTANDVCDAAPQEADMESEALIEAQLMSFDTATVYQNTLPEQTDTVETGTGAEYGAEQPTRYELTAQSKNAPTANTVAPEALDSILSVSAPADYGAHDGTADYTVVFYRGEEAYTLNVWIDGERLYCQDADGNAYYAAGTYAQLLSAMEE